MPLKPQKNSRKKANTDKQKAVNPAVFPCNPWLNLLDFIIEIKSVYILISSKIMINKYSQSKAQLIKFR